MFDDEGKSLEEHALREMIRTVVADLRKYSAAADALLADDAQRGMLISALQSEGAPSDHLTLHAVALEVAKRHAETEGGPAQLLELGPASWQLLFGVVHDFRAPLTMIGGYAELISAEPDEKQRQAYLSVVGEKLEQLDGMMREMLTLARGERELFLRKLYLRRFGSEKN
jgi:signal transduction histidine kinase